MRAPLVAFVAATAALPGVLGGPSTYALCQTASCYSAAGFTFGIVLAIAAPSAVLACNALQGTCMAACAVSLFAPAP